MKPYHTALRLLAALVLVLLFLPTLPARTVQAAVEQSATIPTTACSGSGYMRSLTLTQVLDRNDDWYAGPVSLGFTINFFGTNYSDVYVDNNGRLTFSGESTEYTPYGMADLSLPTIAPFFADVDTRPVGNPNLVYFDQVTVDGHPAFAVHYEQVGYYYEHLDKIDDFMVILISRSDRAADDFDIEFDYGQIQWETGDASGGSGGLGDVSAAIGYSAGTVGNEYFEVPGSLVPGSFLDSNSSTGAVHTSVNSSHCGQWIFPGGTLMDTFGDVPPGYWAETWIYRLYGAGITNGCSSSPLLYCPEDSVTRAQMAKFLEIGKNGAGYTPPAGTGMVFADVSSSYWAVDWIEKLRSDGITNGCLTSPLRYCPDQAVTRDQMAKFLLLAKHGASYTPPPVGGSTGFGDVPTSYWAAAWIKQLAAEGITSGCGGGNYCPGQEVTRAQMAKFLVLTFGLP